MTDSIRLKNFELEIESLKKQLGIPGISGAVIINQEIVWIKGIGYADMLSQRPATPGTAYFISSVTKIFASTILLKMVEENALNLDTPVSDFGIKIKSPGEITVRHLLSHTSQGIPGSQYCYSDRRFYFLEQIMHSVSGCSFDKLLMDNIIKPLKLYNTVPCVMLEDLNYSEVFEKLAKPYIFDNDYKLEETSCPAFFSVNDGLVSSVEDISIYCNALDKNILLSPDTRAMAWTGYLSNDGQLLPYGLGWFVQYFEGHHMVWHHGWNRGFSSLIIKIPVENISLILLANNEELSCPFPLGKGDVTKSPFAVSLLKMFVPQYDRLGNTVIDWSADEEMLKQQIIKIAKSEERELLLRNIIAQYFINLRFKQESSMKKLSLLVSDLFPDKNIKKYI